MKKKSLCKVLAASVAAMLMCAPMMSFSGVYAEDDETPSKSITIQPGENTVYLYEIYQIFTGTVDGEKITDLKWGNSVDPFSVMKALSAAEKNTTNEFYNDLHDSLAGFTESINAKISDGDIGSISSFGEGESEITASIVAEYLNDINTTKANELSRLIYETGLENALSTIDPSNKSIEISDAGYYLILDKTDVVTNNTALSANILKVAGAVTFTPKMSKPTLDKVIVDGDDDVEANTAAIGEDITYKLKTKVPNMTGYNQYYFIVEDTMSEGLTLDPDSFKVRIDGVNEELTNVSKTVNDSDTYTDSNTSYYVETGANAGGDLKFRLVFNNFIQYRDKNGVGTGKDITITYKAKLNNDASFGITTTDSNTNTANLVFSNNPNHKYEGKPEDDNDTPDDDDDIPAKPYEPDDEMWNDDDDPDTPDVPKDPVSKTPEDTVYTYTTQLEVTKIDGKGHALNGAGFTLYKESPNGDESTPTYTKIKEINSSDNNIFTFEGLGKGNYKLVESKIPGNDGEYNKAEDIFFTINADVNDDENCVWIASDIQPEGSAITFREGTQTVNGQTVPDPTKNAFITTVINNKGIVLPTTGGIGTTVFYVSGGVLVLGAGILLITKKRMSLKDDK